MTLVVLFAGACTGGSQGATADPATPNAGSNRAPVAIGDSAMVVAASIDLPVLANDSDPDGDAIQLVSASPPSHGTIQVYDNGTAGSGDDYIRYTPAAAYSGPDAFTYTIQDSGGLRVNGQVTLMVTQAAANAPVVALDDTDTTPAGQPKAIPVLSNDSAAGGGALQIVAVSAAAHGTAVIADNGTAGDTSDDYVVYVPAAGYSGADSFFYTVTDGSSTASAAINVLVTAPTPATPPPPPAVPPPALPPAGMIGGSVIKGPISGARISLYSIDATGLRVSSAPVAQTVTDGGGNWSMLDPLPGQHRLVVASGGAFVDESQPVHDLTSRRVVTLPGAEVLEGVMPSADNYLALTAFSNALLVKSRHETVGGDFADVYANNRSNAATAFGFDIVATVPADPVDPNLSSSDAARQYAIALGGAAKALSGIGVDLGLLRPQIQTIGALVRDLSDCDLDGMDLGGAVLVPVAGIPQAIVGDLDLNLEILRFRNNRFSDFGTTRLPVIDAAVCGQSGALPDTTAPDIAGVPAALSVASAGPSGTPVSAAAIQALLLGVLASDDRDGPVAVSNDAPAVFPPGITIVSFVSSDSSGNTATASVSVQVVMGNAPLLAQAIGALVAVENMPFAADLSFYFNDPDGDSLVFTAAGLPPSMALDPATGSITGTPTNFDAVSAPFTVVVTASDGALVTSDTFSFGIVNTNDAPVLLVPVGDRPASLGTPLTVNAGSFFFDPDGDSLFFTLNGLPAASGLSFDAGTGALSGAPNAADLAASPLGLLVTASDGSLASSDTFMLALANDNNAPQVVAPTGPGLAIEETPFFLDLAAAFVDPDGNALSFSATGLPASLTLDTATGIVTGTPTNADAQASPFSISVTASDGSLSATDNFVLSIANVNDTPVLVSPIGLQSATQDVIFAIDVAGNFADPDNDPLTFSATGLPPSLTIDAATGVISGTPTAADVAAAPFAVTITAGDSLASVTDAFTLNVNLVNNAPILAAPVGPQAGVQGVPFSLDVAGNFSDPDSNVLQFALAGLPAGTGLALDPVSGVLSGVPTNDDWLASPVSLTVTAGDGGLAVTDSFVLTIANANDAPSVLTTIGPRAGAQGTPFSLDVSGNFGDLDNDALVFAATGLPASLAIDPSTGVISGTPTNADFLATPISVTVTVSDGVLTASDTFALSIANVNDAPTLTSPIGPQGGAQGTPLSLNLAASFADPDADILTHSITGLPAGTGLVLDPSGGFLAGTPTNADWLAAPLALTVSVSDGSLSISDSFVLTVANLNDMPTVVAAIGPQAGTQGTPFSLDVSGNFDDPDNDTLTFSAAGLPASLALNTSTGVITGTPTNADWLASPIAVTVTADDGSLSVADGFAVTIANVNDGPTVAAPIGPQAGTQGTPFSLDVSGNFADPDNDPLSFTVTGLPALTGLTMNPTTGVLSGTPSQADADSSPLSVGVTVNDGSLSVGDGFTLTVADLNLAPVEVAPIPATTGYEAVPFSLDASANFADPDGDPLSYSMSGLPGGTGLSIDPISGLISGTPTSADLAASPISVTITAQDPAPLSGSSVFTLTIKGLADVDVTLTVDDAVPVTGSTIKITVRVDNYGPADATGVSVLAPLPVGLAYVSSSANGGSYDSVSGVWSGIDVNNGSSKTLGIDVNVTAAPIEFLVVDSQITAADQDDPDTVDADLLDVVVVGAGADVDWIGGDPGRETDWDSANNWSTGTVPGNFDAVTIPNRPFDPVLDSARSVAKIHVQSDATLNLASNTLTVFGEARSDGLVFGPCPASRIRMVAGKVRGNLPEIEVAGPVETSGDVVSFCSLTITGGRLRVRNDIFVTNDFATLNTGILLQRDGGKHLRVIDDVLFDGGDHSIPVSGSPPLKTGLIYVGGDFTQTGNPHSFAAEKDHMVVLDGSSPQTVILTHPDNSNPAEDDPPLTGSRFARLRIDKDAADGAVDFRSDVAVLKYIEITDSFSPVLRSSTGNRMIAGGMLIEDTVVPQTESATFDGLPLDLVVGDKLKELDGVLFTNMDPAQPQVTIRRPDLDQLHDSKSFSNLRFDTLPDTAAGGAYILADNTNTNPTKNLTLEVKGSYPLHGEPWTNTIGNFTIVWGLPTDDTDADGLTDADEFLLLIDPTDPDSDADGLGDGLEADIGGDPFMPALKVFHVDAIAGNDANDGLSWATAVQTSAGLLAGPLSGVSGTGIDPIHVLYATGGYDTLTLSGRQYFIVAGSLGPATYVPVEPYDSVFGLGDPNGIVLDNSQNVQLLGLRLAGANKVGGSGGGLVLRGASGSDAILRNIEIVDNHADQNGGGFLVEAGSHLTIEDSLVRDNSAGGQAGALGGGGGAVFGGLWMRDSVVADNRATGTDVDDGGAGLLISNAAPVTINDNMILANYALNYGGSVLVTNIGAAVSIKNNLIVGNAVENGTGAALEIKDINAGSPLLVESNTIAHNQALVLQDISGGMNLANAMFTETRNNILFDNQDSKLSNNETDNYADSAGTALVEFNNITKDPTLGANGNQDQDPLFEEAFYLSGPSLSIDAGSTAAAAAGLDDPYTTDKDGVGDSGTLDQGYHYREPSLGDVEEVLVISSVCYAPGELTMVVRPRADDPLGGAAKVPMGPGQIVSVEENPATPTGRIKDESTLTNFKPDGGGTRLAMDEGNGDYRFTVVNVNVLNDEVEIDVYVNHAAGPKTVQSPRTNTIPGC